jgi:hypothetical protein
MALMSLLAAPMATDCESVILMELGELAALCRRFAESDCCDTETFRMIVRRAESLGGEIPPACGPLGNLVYWVLVLFKTRPTDLDRNGVRAVAGALASVRTIWLGPYALEQIRARLRDAGINLRPF